jgi:quinol monooxygenase YgiN
MGKIARHYRMIARPGEAPALGDALAALAQAVRPLPGCLGTELLQDIEVPERFAFTEWWESVAAHKAAGPSLPKAALAPVMAALAGPPEGSYLAAPGDD